MLGEGELPSEDLGWLRVLAQQSHPVLWHRLPPSCPCGWVCLFCVSAVPPQLREPRAVACFSDLLICGAAEPVKAGSESRRQACKPGLGQEGSSGKAHWGASAFRVICILAVSLLCRRVAGSYVVLRSQQ